MGICAAPMGSAEYKRSNAIDHKIRKENLKNNDRVKILLLGPGESGKSTIFKQMKIIQAKGGFTHDETMAFVQVVHSNCLLQMKLLLMGMFQSKTSLESPEANEMAVQLLNYDNFSPEIARWIKILWQDPAVQQFYRSKQNLIQLNDSAAYFFEQVERISQPDYIPAREDILRARLRSTGIEEAEFTFEDIIFNVVDVGGQRSERRKWMHCFSNVHAILFVASLSCYDQNLREDIYQNSMIETLLLFQEVTNSDHFKSNDVILFLNKHDLLQDKITYSPLTELFPEYEGGGDSEKALFFLKNKFLEVTKNKSYVHVTCAINTKHIKKVIEDVRIFLLKKVLDTATMVY